MEVPLAHAVDLAGFNAEATRLLARQVAPASIAWRGPSDGDAGPRQIRPPNSRVRTRAARAVVPQSFVRLSELVVLHRDPGRFDLLYGVLWRLVHEPDLRENPDDPDLMHVRHMAQAVRRDMQKMKARLKFRTLVVKGQPIAFAWHEPSHLVAEAVAAWLVGRQSASRWILLTPDRCALWDGDQLLSAPPLASGATPVATAPDAVWAPVLSELDWI